MSERYLQNALGDEDTDKGEEKPADMGEEDEGSDEQA